MSDYSRREARRNWDALLDSVRDSAGEYVTVGFKIESVDVPAPHDSVPVIVTPIYLALRFPPPYVLSGFAGGPDKLAYLGCIHGSRDPLKASDIKRQLKHQSALRLDELMRLFFVNIAAGQVKMGEFGFSDEKLSDHIVTKEFVSCLVDPNDDFELDFVHDPLLVKKYARKF